MAATSLACRPEWVEMETAEKGQVSMGSNREDQNTSSRSVEFNVSFR